MIIPIKPFEEMTETERQLHLEELVEDYVFIENGNEVSLQEFVKEISPGEILRHRTRQKKARTTRPDQPTWDAKDLMLQPEWRHSRSMTYKLLKEFAERGEIKLRGIERKKIDTTKRYKRAYTRSWISRRDKEKLWRELGLNGR